MATLEKIRSKSVFLIVIIAVALLAFILGDLITNWGRLFGSNTTVATVDGDKIEITDYQQKHQELTQQLEAMRQQNPQAVANFDNQVLSQQAIEQLVDEHLVKKAVGDLKLKPSGEILRFYMIEHPEMMSQDMQAKIFPQYQQLMMSMAQSGLPVNTPEDAYKIIFNPGSLKLTEQQVGPYKRAWLALEQQFSEGIAEMMYFDFIDKSFKANDLDKAAMKKDYVAMASVKVAKKDYTNVKESDYKVSDDEVKKAYNENKERYKVEELTKEVSFIAVNVTPSSADIKASSELAAQVEKEMKSGSGLSKDLKKEGLTLLRNKMRMSDVEKSNPQLAAFLQSASIDSVGLVKSGANGWQLAKLTGRSSEIDSITIQTVEVYDVNVVDDVLNALNSGAVVDSIGKGYEQGKVVAGQSQELPLYTAQGNNDLGLSQELRDSLMTHKGRYMVLNQMQEGALIAAVTDTSSPTSIVSYETVSYDLHPSDATITDAYNKLQKYVTANNTSSKFVENAQKDGYFPVSVDLTSSTPAVPAGMPGRFYPESRSVVRWAMIDGKKGEVSKVFQTRDIENPMLYAAAVVDSYEDYIPWNNQKVKSELTAQVRNSKAGDAMVKQYSGKGSIEATAQAMGVEAQDIPQMRANRQSGVSDMKVVGKIMGSKPNSKVTVVKGDDGVYAYVITSMTEEQVGMTDDQFGDMFLRMHRTQPKKVLRGAKKIENNIYKFEQGE